LLDENDDFAWVTTEDIRAGRAGDGRPLCPRLLSLLKQADILVSYESM
jgi:hypothetical protein